MIITNNVLAGGVIGTVVNLSRTFINVSAGFAIAFKSRVANACVTARNVVTVSTGVTGVFTIYTFVDVLAL